MRVTQKAIAEKLGVSISLVSRVLSGKAELIGVPTETIELVEKTCDEMGYVPNVAAQILKGKSTRTIGVVVYDFKDPFFSEVIAALQKAAFKKDYSTLLVGFWNRQIDDNTVSPLHKHSLDGLIVLGSDEESNWLENFLDLPVARIGYGFPSESSACIVPDDTEAIDSLLDSLIQEGFKDFHFIGTSQVAHQKRQNNYRLALFERGIKLNEHTVKNKAPFELGFESVNELLDQQISFDVILCATDQVAMGVIRSLSQRGITSGGKIRVVGYDNIAFAQQFTPSLSTIAQPIHHYVEEAIQVMERKQNLKTEIRCLSKLLRRETG